MICLLACFVCVFWGWEVAVPEESRRVGHELPGLDDDSENRTEHLTSANCEDFGEEAGHVCAERNRVCAEVGREYSKHEGECDKEDSGTSTCAEMVIKDRV
jgi:hypothetical protein